MAVDFQTFGKIVKHVTAVGKPVLLRGRHGIGKSTVVYQYAKHIDMPVVERRASQMTEGDLVGLPSISGDATKFNPPKWFVEACRFPVVLFLDEIDRATIEVRQGIFELTDSRKLNGHCLHEDTLIFAAVNGGEHGAQYQVGEMDPAELDRWTVFDVEPSTEDWLLWAKDAGVSSQVWNFINSNHEHLEHKDDFEPNKVYPSRRSWERLDECLSSAGLLEEASPELMQLTTAFVGIEAAVAFSDFIGNYEKQVTVDDILVHGKIELTQDFTISQHNAMVEKFAASDVFVELMDGKPIENFAKYLVTLPSEVGMKAWSVIGKGNAENIINLHKVELKGIKLVAQYMVSILGGDND